MTTGRINQVTILALMAARPPVLLSTHCKQCVRVEVSLKIADSPHKAGISVMESITSAKAECNDFNNIHLPRLNSLNSGPRRVTLDIRRRRSNESLHTELRRRL